MGIQGHRNRIEIGGGTKMASEASEKFFVWPRPFYAVSGSGNTHVYVHIMHGGKPILIPIKRISVRWIMATY